MNRRLAITAIHEAGHAYAAQLRGGTVTSIKLAPGEVWFTVPHIRHKLFRNGQLIADPVPVATDPIIHFAGPWAEAKAWHMPNMDAHMGFRSVWTQLPGRTYQMPLYSRAAPNLIHTALS